MSEKKEPVSHAGLELPENLFIQGGDNKPIKSLQDAKKIVEEFRKNHVGNGKQNA